MKKGLILLPLLALAVTACTSTGGGSKKKKSTTHETGLTTHDSSSSGSQSSGSSGSSGSKSSSSSVAPTPGQAHDVPWLLDAQNDLYDPNASGYAGYEGDHNVDGTVINFHDVMITNNPAGDEHTGEKNGYAIQFSGPKSRDPGVMTISSIKAVGSIEAKVLIKNTYEWSATQIGTLTFGNGAITVPGTSTSVVSDYDANWNLHTVEIPVNATAEGDFVIKNTGNFAFYIVSLHFKA